MQYCSLQHQTLLLSPVTSTTWCCFCFGSLPSVFLELFFHWSPVAYWAPTYLGSSSFSVLSFCLFILFMGFSRQEYWSGLPFPSPVDHILSDFPTMTTWGHFGCPTWHGLVSLSSTRLWSMWSDWLVVCDLVSVCLPSYALSHCLPSYLDFSYLGYGLSLHGCSSKAQPLLLTWTWGLGRRVSPHSHRSWPWM